MLNEYDRIAGFYDILAKIIFGNTIKRSQLFFLNHIKEKDAILIIGGGTGWILEAILAHVLPSKITYIEASAKMIALSKGQSFVKKHQDKIEFIHTDHLAVISEERYDVVITNFFLDLFTHTAIKQWEAAITNLLKPKALWLISDFQINTSSKNSIWQSFLSMAIHYFFKSFTHLKRRHFPDWSLFFQSENLSLLASQTFFKHMIFSKVYQSSKDES